MYALVHVVMYSRIVYFYLILILKNCSHIHVHVMCILHVQCVHMYDGVCIHVVHVH